MLTWFPFTIVEMLRSCIIKLLARFPRIKLHDDGFVFFSQYFYLCRFSQLYGHDQYFHLGMEDSFLRSILLPAARHHHFFHYRYIQFHESHLIMSWSIVFTWMAIFPSNSSIVRFCSSKFSSNLEIISSFNFLIVF